MGFEPFFGRATHSLPRFHFALEENLDGASTYLR
jgi:hypothetical protein